ncbi:MAG TPA: SMC-Scp complex subunit ScpB [Acidobacteriota bacterium]
MEDLDLLGAAAEALIYAAEEPITTAELLRVLKPEQPADLERALEQLRESTNTAVRGLRLVEVAGGWRFETRPEFGPVIEVLYHDKLRRSLSRAALETLAIIAYRQPITLQEISELRGVDSGAVLRTLLERRLIRIAGRREALGRPLIYVTTKEFLLYFGLKDLTDLPTLEEFQKLAEAQEGSPNPFQPDTAPAQETAAPAAAERSAEREPAIEPPAESG